MIPPFGSGLPLGPLHTLGTTIGRLSCEPVSPPLAIGEHVRFSVDVEGSLDGCGWEAMIPAGSVGRIEAIWHGQLLLEVQHSRLRRDGRQIWVRTTGSLKRVSALEALAHALD